MSHSPAKVLSSRLIAGGVFSAVASDTDWPIFIGNMPDGEGVNDAVGCVYDREGRDDGANIETGEAYEHVGVQLIVRGKDYDTTFAKIKAAAEYCDALKNATVTIGATTYTIGSVGRISTIACMGLEPGNTRRFLFSINFVLTITAA